jgi:hypothetical protein
VDQVFFHMLSTIVRAFAAPSSKPSAPMPPFPFIPSPSLETHLCDEGLFHLKILKHLQQIFPDALVPTWPPVRDTVFEIRDRAQRLPMS